MDSKKISQCYVEMKFVISELYPEKEFSDNTSAMYNICFNKTR